MEVIYILPGFYMNKTNEYLFEYDILIDTIEISITVSDGEKSAFAGGAISLEYAKTFPLDDFWIEMQIGYLFLVAEEHFSREFS